MFKKNGAHKAFGKYEPQEIVNAFSSDTEDEKNECKLDERVQTFIKDFALWSKRGSLQNENPHISMTIFRRKIKTVSVTPDFFAPYEKAASNLETAAMFGIFKCFTFELSNPVSNFTVFRETTGFSYL